MAHFNSRLRCLPRIAIVRVAVSQAAASRHVESRVIPFVVNDGANTVGSYAATTGATINAAFMNAGGLSVPPHSVFACDGLESSSIILVATAMAVGLSRCRRELTAL
jgi:hypothetical protein